MYFGHRAIKCKGPVRSEHCGKCSEKGQVGRDYLKIPNIRISGEGRTVMTMNIT